MGCWQRVYPDELRAFRNRLRNYWAHTAHTFGTLVGVVLVGWLGFFGGGFFHVTEIVTEVVIESCPSLLHLVNKIVELCIYLVICNWTWSPSFGLGFGNSPFAFGSGSTDIVALSIG